MLWLVTAVQVVCQMAPMLSKHLLSVTPVVAQVRGPWGMGFRIQCRTADGWMESAAVSLHPI
jgi:hypothetical protein